MAREAHERRAVYKVKPVVFGGKGLSPEYAQASWEKIRGASYRGREA